MNFRINDMNTMLPRRDGRADVSWHDSELVADFTRDGALIYERFYDQQTCAALMDTANGLVTNLDPPPNSAVFSTVHHAHASERYFLESADDVRMFFEDGAIDEQGQLLVPIDRAVNKLGHALHERIDEFVRLARDRRLAGLCSVLGMKDPRVVQSMYIFKQPHIGGEVVWHQDSTFLYTEPPSVVGFWVALEDADQENGCLWVMPGGHRLGLKQRWRRSVNDEMSFDVLDASPWPDGPRVPLEVPAGTLVVLHGALPHFSAPNLTPRSRYAYTVHVVDGQAKYAPDNWLQRVAEGDFPRLVPD